MAYIITGTVCFVVGVLFGAFWISALTLAKQADEDMEKQEKQ